MRIQQQQIEKMRVPDARKSRILLSYFCILCLINIRIASAEQTRTILSDAPSLVPSDVPSVFPNSNPSITPTSVQNAEFVISSISSDAPSLIPSNVPSSTPIDLASDLPSIIPPRETTSEAPNGILSLIPSIAPTSVENAEFLSESPSLAPSDFPSVLPVDSPSDIPSLVPSVAPTIVQNAEFISSDFPSISPITIPSNVPSGIPDYAKSDTPSLVPSDVPSLTPNYVPSQIPSERPSSSVVEIQNGTSLYQFFVIPDPIYVQTQFPDTMDRDTVAEFETVCANDFLPAYLQLTKDGVYKNLTCDVIDQTIIDGKTKPTGQLLINRLRRMRQDNLSDNENQTYQLEIILSVSGLSSFSPSDSDIKSTVSETFTTFGPILEDKLGSEIGFFNDPSADSINSETNKSTDDDSNSIAVRWQLVLAAVFAGAVLSVIAALYVLRRAYVLGPHSAVSGTQSDLQASGSANSGEIVFDVNTATSRMISLRSSRSSGRNKVQPQDQTSLERQLPPINCKLSAAETAEYPGPHPLTSINACDDNGVDFESDISASLYDEGSACHRTNGSNTITELRPDGTIVKRERSPTDDNNSLGGIILSVSGLLRGLNEKLDGVISPKNMVPRKPSKQSFHDDERRSDTSSELEGLKLFSQGTGASKGSSICSQTPILDSLLSFRKKKASTDAELQKFHMFMSESSSTPDDPQEALDDVVCITGSSRSRSNTNTTDSDKHSSTYDHDNDSDEGDNEDDELIFVHPNDRSKQIQYRSRIESPDDSYGKIKSRLPPRRAGSIGSGNRRPLPPPSRSSTGSDMMAHITDTLKKSNRSNRIIHYGRPPTPPSTRTRSNSISSNNDDPDPALMTICSL